MMNSPEEPSRWVNQYQLGKLAENVGRDCAHESLPLFEKYGFALSRTGARLGEVECRATEKARRAMGIIKILEENYGNLAYRLQSNLEKWFDQDLIRSMVDVSILPIRQYTLMVGENHELTARLLAPFSRDPDEVWVVAKSQNLEAKEYQTPLITSPVAGLSFLLLPRSSYQADRLPPLPLGD